MEVTSEMVIGSLALGGAVGIGVFSAGDQIERGFQFLESDLADKLKKLRSTTPRLRRYLIAWLTVTVLAAIVGGTLFQAPVLACFVALLMVGLPWYLVRRKARQRAEQIEDQMADSMVSLSSSIRAGLSLAQAVELLSQQCPFPIRQEFQQFYGEYRMGKTLEQCLDETRARLESENFALFAAAMEASRRSGGKLNETVERIAHSVREMQRLERKVRSDTASARTSSTYMALAPLFVLTVYYLFVDPVSTQRLFTTLYGQMILAIVVVFNLVAYFWSRAILETEI